MLPNSSILWARPSTVSRPDCTTRVNEQRPANHTGSSPSVMLCRWIVVCRFGSELVPLVMRKFYRDRFSYSSSHISPNEAYMSILKVAATFLLCLLASALLLAQTANLNSAMATSGGASPAAETKEAPKLEHFDPSIVDNTLDPCDDFYKYSCSKWLTTNPIPPDQVYWGTGSGLELWNENLLRETLEAASTNDPKRSAVNKKIGDYWAACMDESGIEAAGLKPVQPELDRIGALKSKKEITLEIAHLHHLFPGAWEQSDNQTNAPLFGFTGQQDYDDASKVVAQIDQGGLSLPNRDYYLKTDEKSAEILKKYRAHLQKMFALAGEPETQAAADAGTMIELETEIAKAQMDNIKRRDP